jgi:hypothetical protein
MNFLEKIKNPFGTKEKALRKDSGVRRTQKNKLTSRK